MLMVGRAPWRRPHAWPLRLYALPWSGRIWNRTPVRPSPWPGGLAIDSLAVEATAISKETATKGPISRCATLATPHPDSCAWLARGGPSRPRRKLPDTHARKRCTTAWDAPGSTGPFPLFTLHARRHLPDSGGRIIPRMMSPVISSICHGGRSSEAECGRDHALQELGRRTRSIWHRALAAGEGCRRLTDGPRAHLRIVRASYKTLVPGTSRRRAHGNG